jgi:hypothetical protein
VNALSTALAALAPAAAASAQPDIRDIRGPIAIPSVWPVLLMVACAVALAVLLGLAIYWIVRRVRRAHIKTPAEIALERLARAKELAGEGHAGELAEELSDAARDYVQARFELRAPRLTTEEFLHDLLSQRESPVAAHRDALGQFLGACDLAKFARFAIDVEHQRAMVDAAASFVRATDAPNAPPTHEATP